MEIPNNYYRVSIRALVLNEEGKFLLIKTDTGAWTIPGGGLDFGETIEECVRREVKEEMNVEIDSIAKEPSYFLIFEYNGNWMFNILYLVKLKKLDFTPTSECVEVRFFSKEDVLNSTEKMTPNIFELIKQFQE